MHVGRQHNTGTNAQCHTGTNACATYIAPVWENTRPEVLARVPLCVFSLFGSAFVWAGSVGRVVDGSGAVVPGVAVRISNLDTSQTYRGLSNGAGDYWNLTLEREFGGGSVLEVAYAGSKGTHLPRQYTLNQQPLIPGVKAGPWPIAVFGRIATFADVSNSIITNRTSLGLPQTQVDVLIGATISSAKAPRQMQVGLRLEF